MLIYRLTVIRSTVTPVLLVHRLKYSTLKAHFLWNQCSAHTGPLSMASQQHPSSQCSVCTCDVSGDHMPSWLWNTDKTEHTMHHYNAVPLARHSGNVFHAMFFFILFYIKGFLSSSSLLYVLDYSFKVSTSTTITESHSGGCHVNFPLWVIGPAA